MLSLRVNEILEKRSLTPYWLGKQTGISQNNILKICNGETATIRFDTIEKYVRLSDAQLVNYSHLMIHKCRSYLIISGTIIVPLHMYHKQDRYKNSQST